MTKKAKGPARKRGASDIDKARMSKAVDRCPDPERAEAYLLANAPEAPDPGQGEAAATAMVRVPRPLLDRAEALVPALAGRPELAAVARASGAAVVRVALALGLTELERRAGGGR